MASQLFPRKMACVASRRVITAAHAMPLTTTVVRCGRGLRTLAEFPRLTVPRGSIPTEIAKKYQPFLLDPSVESSDWISELQLETVATMVQESMAEDHKRTKILVVFDSQYPRSPGKHVAYEACRLLHKLGFVVRALDLDSLEDRKVLGKNQKPKSQGSLNQLPSQDVSTDSPSPIQEVPEKKIQDTLFSHDSKPASSEDHSKKEPHGITPSAQEHPDPRYPTHPVDRPPLHIPRPEKEFFELIMWADAQIWCFPEKTNDLLSICNRHFAEGSGPLMQGQPIPILYFNDSPSPVYQNHAIRHTIGQRRKLVPIPTRTDLQGIHAHPNQRMSEGGMTTRFVNAIEDLAKYTSILCRKKNDATFKYKYNTEKARAKRQAAKSTALAGATESVGSKGEPEDEKKVVEKKQAFMRLLDLPKEKVTNKPEIEEEAVQEEARKIEQEAKLLRLKKLLGIEVSTGEDKGSKYIQSTEDSQATGDVWPQSQKTGEAGVSDSKVQEEIQVPVDPQATEKTVVWTPLVRTCAENGAAKPSSSNSRD